MASGTPRQRSKILKAFTEYPKRLLSEHIGPGRDCECGICREVIGPRVPTLCHRRTPSGNRGCEITYCQSCWIDWAVSAWERNQETTCPNCRGRLLSRPVMPNTNNNDGTGGDPSTIIQTQLAQSTLTQPSANNLGARTYAICIPAQTASQLIVILNTGNYIEYGYLTRDQVFALPLNQANMRQFGAYDAFVSPTTMYLASGVPGTPTPFIMHNYAIWLAFNQIASPRHIFITPMTRQMARELVYDMYRQNYCDWQALQNMINSVYW